MCENPNTMQTYWMKYVAETACAMAGMPLFNQITIKCVEVGPFKWLFSTYSATLNTHIHLVSN